MGKSKNTRQSRYYEKTKRSDNSYFLGKKKKRRMTAQEIAAKSKDLAIEMKKQCYKCEEMLDKARFGYKQWIAIYPKDRKSSHCILPPDLGISGAYVDDCVNIQENENDYDWDDVYVQDPGDGNSIDRDNIQTLSEQATDWIRRTF